ncbi:hypothetical protein SeMB42_g00403 [Synchytrium endobioticum]|uniref:Rhodanese domain-containing protein n=1 Tax=Synchytrium endobioticum TaxID=286115 RepID=A0A507DT91_9FUNG|nr:hypothetical protein SeLEV6574_g02556 [Synchytrium endobioticum]TPX54168.1 hypothetical protein SeMB42_g00403 [Synchytrium endobioticum]
MSSVSMPTFITPDELTESLLRNPAKKAGRDYIVVDVREKDEVEKGKVSGSINIASSDILANLDKYVREIKADRVIFHCALSQVRGPRTALRFLTALNNDIGGPHETDLNGCVAAKKPEVVVLKGGFAAFQQRYGKDTELVQDYDEEFWKDFA